MKNSFEHKGTIRLLVGAQHHHYGNGKLFLPERTGLIPRSVIASSYRKQKRGEKNIISRTYLFTLGKVSMEMANKKSLKSNTGSELVSIGRCDGAKHVNVDDISYHFHWSRGESSK